MFETFAGICLFVIAVSTMRIAYFVQYPPKRTLDSEEFERLHKLAHEKENSSYAKGE